MQTSIFDLVGEMKSLVDGIQSKRVSHSYYVAMIDYGTAGLEANVHPEDTRRDIIDMLKSGETKHVVFIHHVDGLLIEDVTEELFNEAEAELRALNNLSEDV
jgi:hypothetical protein